VLFCVLWTKSTAGDETIPIYGPVAGSGRVRCGPVGSDAVNSQTEKKDMFRSSKIPQPASYLVKVMPMASPVLFYCLAQPVRKYELPVSIIGNSGLTTPMIFCKLYTELATHTSLTDTLLKDLRRSVFMTKLFSIHLACISTIKRHIFPSRCKQTTTNKAPHCTWRYTQSSDATQFALNTVRHYNLSGVGQLGLQRLIDEIIDYLINRTINRNCIITACISLINRA